MKILVLNAGSSSLKYQLFEMPEKLVLVSGLVEKIGEEKGAITHRIYNNDGSDEKYQEAPVIPDHVAGLKRIVALLMDTRWGSIKESNEIAAVGHRVVHGGEKFSAPTIVTKDVLEELKKLSFLAPLHNPPNIKGIEIASNIFPESIQVAVFDTAFHQSMPDYAYRFAIPEVYYKDKGLRAYGFHGTSHQFVSREAAKFLNINLSSFNAISIHLGNGCSMTAIQNGKKRRYFHGTDSIGRVDHGHTQRGYRSFIDSIHG